jgi:phage N-6-adenine-methyltransferase
MNTELMFSSKTDEWETPQDLFDKLNTEFKFDLDVCCNEYNCKCEIGYMKSEEDQGGLSKKWFGSCWMNPPYGRKIGEWVKKAYEESRGGLCGRLLTSCQN